MSAVKIAGLLVLAAALFVGAMVAVDEYRIYRAKQALVELGTVDGYTPAQQAEIMAKAGTSRFYSQAEIDAHIASEQKRLGIKSSD